MNKRLLVLAPMIALGLYGIGFLAANDWHIPVQALHPNAAAAQPAVQSVMMPGHAADTSEFLNTAPENQAGAPDSGAALSGMHYRNIQQPATLSADEVARIYRLNDLPEADGHLIHNNRTRTIVEDMVMALPREDVLAGRHRIEQAVALRLGQQAASEFSALIVDYLKYQDAVAAIDEVRNARGYKPSDANENDYLLRQRLQSEAFGPERAAGLFGVERQLLALMAKQTANAGESPAELSPAQIEGLKAEYQEILKNDESR
ncbi:MAG: lipase secretion chaperone [Fluviicoccus sp.]|uniref:lipase secretion chaperone n=1 Tax=Fluviicoccus sp. TaxID=2003552 RepID=UPI00271F3E5C|nr:lipase secretion chaperone [Fluviicoccus sp.]MDO8331148.1 lipase secretion chaperone [Fluviicoccus sp.]